MTPFGRVKKNTVAAGLNGSAHGNQTFVNQTIKGRQNAFIPDIRQMRFYLSAKRSVPMLLAGPANPGNPLAGL